MSALGSDGLSRRDLLRATASLAGGVFLFGCGEDAPRADGGLSDALVGDAGCDEGLAGAVLEGRARLVSERVRPLETLVGDGLDGRYYTDLTELAPRDRVLPTERFFVRTRSPDQLDLSAGWSVRVGGLVAEEVVWPMERFRARSVDQGVVLLECSGNPANQDFGLLGAARWEGVPVAEVLASARATDGAAQVRVAGFDGHSQPSTQSVAGAAWVFPREELVARGAFLATRMNGAPLTPDHGFPVRLVVPGWYGCTCIKWVDRVELVDDGALATSQMTEFATRTHQPSPAPRLAREFLPARVDPAAMALRVERWRAGSAAKLRVVGVFWGGDQGELPWELRVGEGPWQPVTVCSARESARTWGFWSAVRDLPRSGTHALALRVGDPSVRTRRLDLGYYTRRVTV